MSHRSITILAVGAAVAALAPASAALAQSAPAPAAGSGVPAGKIELTVRSVHVTGSNAVPRYERARQYLTADRSHTVTMTVPGHKLRFEGVTSPQRELRYDAKTNRITRAKGFATPPYQTVAQEAAGFAEQVAQGCWTAAGNLVYANDGRVFINGNLSYPVKLIFDRILDCNYLIFFVSNLVKRGVQRSGFTGSGGPRNEYHPIWFGNVTPKLSHVIFGKSDYIEP